jgi:membrane fusion protein (multidrug efflux system)
MIRCKTWFLIMVMPGLMLLGCGSGGQDQDIGEKVPVQVTRPLRQGVEDVLHFIGELRADKEAGLDFNVSGRIARFNYEVGDRVPRGAIMASIRQEEILAQLEQTKAAYEKSEADLKRLERLHGEQIVSDDRLEAARVGAKQAKTAYVMAQEALKNSSVIAPFSGSVAQKNGEVGEYYNAMMGGPSVYRLVKIDSVKVLIGIPELEVPKVSLGQEARITTDTYPGMIFYGQVTRVGLTIDRFSRTLEVEIGASNDQRLMKPGMMADIDLVVGHREKVLSIPQKAVIRDMGLEHIFLVEDGKALLRQITSGAKQDDAIEIVAGLTGGEQVVVEGQFGLKEGDLVSIVSKTSSPKDE